MTDIVVQTQDTDPVFESIGQASPPPPAESPAAPASPDALGFDAVLRGVAELTVHRTAGQPQTVALLGPSGSGKSFALTRLLTIASGLSRGSGAGLPYVPDALVARVNAGAGGEPAAAVAGAVYEALRASGERNAVLAEEAAVSGSDPADAARTASERLMEMRRRLDNERHALRELTGRRARLVDTVLHQSGGSRVDAWARANRGRIEGRLRAFGFESGDPIVVFKDLVRDVADKRGLMGRVSVFIHAMWAFRGQGRLLFLAAACFLVAWAFGSASEARDAWLGAIRSQEGWGEGAAAWLEKYVWVLAAVRTLAVWATLGCLALNVARAARFVAPLLRGSSLLALDLEAGQREIDALIGNQTRLVDDLAAQADAQARRTEEAERRVAILGAHRREDVSDTPFAAAESEPRRRARQFMRALAREASSGVGPQRIVVALDELDALAPAQAAAFVDEAARLLDQPPFVLVIAADPERLVQGWGVDGAARLARRVQIGVRVDAASSGDYARLVRHLLGPAPTVEASAPIVDYGPSIWDRPVSADEARLLEALAPLAGRTPGDVARFVTVYRLARARAGDWAALAFALALEMGGGADERAAFDRALRAVASEGVVDVAGLPARLAQGLSAAAAASAIGAKAPALRDALALARTYVVSPSAAVA